jgi:hypothetical protein
MADDQDSLMTVDGTVKDPGGVPAAPPCAMVIFGAAGDLTKRLVVPALYNLVNSKRLAEGFQLVGVDLAAKSTADWRQALTDMMNEFVSKGAPKSLAVYWEHVVAVTDTGCELLELRDGKDVTFYDVAVRA